MSKRTSFPFIVGFALLSVLVPLEALAEAGAFVERETSLTERLWSLLGIPGCSFWRGASA